MSDATQCASDIFVKRHTPQMSNIDIADSWIAPQDDAHLASLPPRWCPTVCANGSFVKLESGIASAECAIVARGLSFSSEFVSRGVEPYLWRETYFCLLPKAKAIRLNSTAIPSAESLKRSINLLVSKNHYPPFSRFRIIFWQHGQSPSDLRWIMLEERLKANPYSFEKKAITIDDRPERIIFPSPISEAGIMSAEAKVMHAEAQERSFDCACYRNTDGNIATTSLGNIYLLNGRTAITPSLKAGAQSDATQTAVFNAMKDAGYNCQFVDELTHEMVQNAQECLVANPTFGIRCVGQLGRKVFYTDGSRSVAQKFSGYFIF